MSHPVIKRRLVTRRAAEPNIRATVFNVSRTSGDTSRQIDAIDEFAGIVVTGNGSILLPAPYNVGQLMMFREQSNMLAQCIDAYVTNIVLTGWEVDDLYRGKEGQEGEKHELQSFLDHANVDQSLIGVMSDTIRDRETVGFGFIEVIRDASDRVSLLRNAPAKYTRLCSKHAQEVLISYEILRGRRISAVREYKRFRRYVQIIHGTTRWFKEFGDPRKMDRDTGWFEGETGYTPGNDATELIHLRLPSTDSYGVPRWINQVPSIIGSRESEEVNMRYFQDNTVPPMLLLVGNGRLTAASYDELTRTINQEGLGGARQHKIMLLEAVGESDSLDGKSSNIDLKVEKLTDARQSDGLFREYDQANMGKVRSSFRLPPVLVGMSQDVNFATATTSVFVAESQVFAPERSVLDEMLNRLLVNGISGMALRTVKLTSRTPSITSPEMVVKTLTALNVMGALTPRSAQAVANKMLQLEVGTFPAKGEEGYEEWMDLPIAMSLRAGKTDEEQAGKDPKMKELEDNGDVAPSQPKHGEE